MSSRELIPKQELRQIPFLTDQIDSSRCLPTLVFYVQGEWHAWLTAAGKVHKVKMWPMEGNYFGDQAEKPTDQRFLFLEFLAYRTLHPQIYGQFYGIWNDFQCLATSLAKMQLFFKNEQRQEVRRFVQSEIEYVILVCRSLFDLLQEVIAHHWGNIRIGGAKPRKTLPKSFADVILHKDAILSSTDIQRKYDMLPAIADWYVKQASFFLCLRSLRDRIVHGGINAVEMLFVTERGFAINRGQEPYCNLYQWTVDCDLPNSLVPLRPVLCNVIRKVRDVCDSFAAVVQGVGKFPGDLAPSLKFFSRGCHDNELSNVDRVVDDCLWDDTE